MARKDCYYRITNKVNQHICDLSCYYLGRSKCCEQIDDKTCVMMKKKEELECMKEENEYEEE